MTNMLKTIVDIICTFSNDNVLVYILEQLFACSIFVPSKDF